MCRCMNPSVCCMQRGNDSASRTPEQLQCSPLPPGLSGSPQGSAVTPIASTLPPGSSGSNPLMPPRTRSGGSSLAAALARAAPENSPALHNTASGTGARHSPARAAGNSPTRDAAFLAPASGAVGFTGPHSKTGLRAVTGATQQATRAAGVSDPTLLVATGSRPAAVSRQEEASSSASFDSWHSKNHGDSATTAATAWIAPAAATTAVGSSRQYPDTTAAADAQGSCVNNAFAYTVPPTVLFTTVRLCRSI